MRRATVTLMASVGLISGIALAFQPPAPPTPVPSENQPKQPERPMRPPGERGPGERGPGERWPGERGPGERGGEGRQGQPSVGGAMKGMARAMRTLRKQVDDPTKRDENLKLLSDMQRSCLFAKSMPLPQDYLKDAKDDTARAKLAAKYHAELIQAMRLMLDVESDLTEGKGADAKRSLEELIDLRDDTHKELGVKED